VSRRSHHIIRLVLSGAAALFAYTVVIISRPAVTPAAAAPERPHPARRATVDGRSHVRPLVTPIGDPRQRLLRFGR
jgi:hypothetical protein